MKTFGDQDIQERIVEKDTIKLTRLVFQLCYEFNSYRLIPKLYSVNGYNSKPIKKTINMPTTNLQRTKTYLFYS